MQYKKDKCIKIIDKLYCLNCKSKICNTCVRHVHYAIGCKSRTGVVVLTVSQEQGCRGWLRIWKKLAANIRSYEQKLNMRRDNLGDVACETKALHYTEDYFVDSEETWIESKWTYPERTGNALFEILLNIKTTTSIVILNGIVSSQPRL